MSPMRKSRRRWASRLKRRFEAGGAAALAHRSRGRPSGRRLAARIRQAVIRLMTTVYAGFNDSHLTEKLREVHQLAVSRESARRSTCSATRTCWWPDDRRV